MGWGKVVLNKEESFAITPLDKQIMNTILNGLLKCKDNTAKKSRIYTYCRRELNKPRLCDYKIMCCILILRLQSLIKIRNIKIKEGWRTYISLNRMKYEEFKIKKEIKEEYNT